MREIKQVDLLLGNVHWGNSSTKSPARIASAARKGGSSVTTSPAIARLRSWWDTTRFNRVPPKQPTAWHICTQQPCGTWKSMKIDDRRSMTNSRLR